MPTYQVEDCNRQTVLLKDGELSLQTDYPTLLEAVLAVESIWSKDDQEKARFEIVDKRRQYSWSDLEPYLD